MAILTLFFAALGFILPSSSGIFLTIAIVLYLLFGILAGYLSVWMWSHMKGKSKEWVSVSLATSCFFSSILFAILSVMNTIYYMNTSTAAISFSVYSTLLALWLFISVPLTFLGGLTSTRSISNELRTEHRRRTPVSLFHTVTVILLSGFITYGSISTELAYIFYCTWGGRSYCDLQHTLIITHFIVITCVSVSGWGGYMCIIADDWNWGWKAFFASGSSGLYVFIYSVKYLVFDLRGPTETASVVICIGYSIIMALAVVLATGVIGFLGALGVLNCLALLKKL